MAWVALSACVSYEPDPLVPESILDALAQRADHGLRTDAAVPWRAEWFPLESEVDVDDGITIGEANALVLFYSPALRLARTEAQVVGARVLQAGVLQNPQLFVGPRISTENSEVIFPVSLSWQLPLWGVREARRDAAKASLSAESLAIIGLELEALRDVRSAFLRLGRLRRELEMSELVASAGREVVEWVERLRESGEVDAATLFLARGEHEDAALTVERLRSQAVRSRRELLGMLGLLPDAPVDFDIDSGAHLPALATPEREALLRLPELRAAESRYAEAEAGLRMEISKQYPGLNLGLQFESDRGDPMFGPGIGVTLPLFDRNRGGIAAAEAARRRARENYERALLEATHREARARDDLMAAQRMLELCRDGALGDAESAKRALDVRVRTGQADVVEVLAAQRAIGDARSRFLQLEEQVAVARLRAAVSGGLALRASGSVCQEANR